MQFGRKIPEFRGTSVHSPVGGGKQIPVQVGHHVGAGGMIAHTPDGGIEKPVRSVINDGMIRQEFRSAVSLKATHLVERLEHAFSDQLLVAVSARMHEIGAQYLFECRLPLYLPVFGTGSDCAA